MVETHASSASAGMYLGACVVASAALCFCLRAGAAHGYYIWVPPYVPLLAFVSFVYKVRYPTQVLPKHLNHHKQNWLL